MKGDYGELKTVGLQTTATKYTLQFSYSKFMAWWGNRTEIQEGQLFLLGITKAKKKNRVRKENPCQQIVYSKHFVYERKVKT